MSTIIRPSLSLTNVYLYRDPVDFRKSFKGLAVLVEQELGHNPFDGYLYAFTNRHRNKIKCLFWEDNGVVLYYKSLSEDKFRWPKKADEVVHLTSQQLRNPLIICATYSSFCPMRILLRSWSSLCLGKLREYPLNNKQNSFFWRLLVFSECSLNDY